MGYQSDTAAAVVFQASNQLYQLQTRRDGCQLWRTAWESGLSGDCALADLDEEEGSKLWKQAVSAWILNKIYLCIF